MERLRFVAIVLVLLGVSGLSSCKKPRIIYLDNKLMQVNPVEEGQTIIFRPVDPKDSITVRFPAGLCENNGSPTATAREPAICKVAKQAFDDKNGPKKYDVPTSPTNGEGPGVTVEVYVSRCKGGCLP